MTNQNLPVYPSGSNSIAIELLRPGTPHNQTLSPGVTYLALCGAHPPAEFRINLEQYKFSRYLQLLRYKEGTVAPSIQLAREALQEIITKIFEEIPALQTEASFSDGWLHLHLIMTPRELAMLPFELALTPDGFQGARDKPFLLNPQRLTTITREVRQVAPKKYNLPAKPRILFAWADAQNPVPAEDHAVELRAALLPWACPNTNKPEPEADYEPRLTVLPNATLSQLQTAVKEAVRQNNPFTHVHLLAHGVPIADPDNGPRFALALHTEKPIPKADGSMTQTDAVDGARLADALLVVQNNHTYSPAVVTIAACDGGNEGTNLLPGGSLGHILHQSGVPYVLASQFPLSIPGSIQLVRDLYPRLLHGEDPRTALYYARQALLSNPNVHDWASLVAYARFPDDFDDQLEDNRLKIAFDLIRATNAWSDYLTQHQIKQEQTYEIVTDRLKSAIAKLENLLPQDVDAVTNQARLAEHFGLLGSAHKRLAEHRYRQGNQTETKRDELLKQSRKALEKARGYYQRGHDLLLVRHWNAVQYLAMTALFKGTLASEQDRWCVARFAAEKELNNPTGQDWVWSLGSLAELYLLKPFTVSVSEFEAEKIEAITSACAYLDKLAESDFAFAKESTARQLDRYIHWWPAAFPSPISEQLREMAIRLRERLPALDD